MRRHVQHAGVGVRQAGGPSGRLLVAADARGGEGDRTADAAAGQRNAEVGAGRLRGSDAGHYLDRDAGGGQRVDFFLGAAEQHRVATLQPHHPRMLGGGIDQALVDETLCRRMRAATLAYRDLYSICRERYRLRMH